MQPTEEALLFSLFFTVSPFFRDSRRFTRSCTEKPEHSDPDHWVQEVVVLAATSRHDVTLFDKEGLRDFEIFPAGGAPLRGPLSHTKIAANPQL